MYNVIRFVKDGVHTLYVQPTYRVIDIFLDSIVITNVNLIKVYG